MPAKKNRNPSDRYSDTMPGFEAGGAGGCDPVGPTSRPVPSAVLAGFGAGAGGGGGKGKAGEGSGEKEDFPTRGEACEVAGAFGAVLFCEVELLEWRVEPEDEDEELPCES